MTEEITHDPFPSLICLLVLLTVCCIFIISASHIIWWKIKEYLSFDNCCFGKVKFLFGLVTPGKGVIKGAEWCMYNIRVGMGIFATALRNKKIQ